MKRYRCRRIEVRRAARGVVARVRRLPALLAWCLPLLAVQPASLQAVSPIENSYGDLNAHLQVHGAAVNRANAPAQTGGRHDPNQALYLARRLLDLRVDLQVPYDPSGDFSGAGIAGGGVGGRIGGIGGDLTTDLFVQQQVAIDNWAPGGVNFPGAFNDRGTLVAQGGEVVITPTSSYQIGNFNLQTAAINGQYTFINDLDAPHGANVHSPFDITSSASGSADTTTDTSEVRVDLQWVGTYSHPEEAYDPPQGGGYAPPIGALDFFTFDIQGNAAAQYFSPTGLGGSNQQPGLPDLPDLPPLPDFDNPLLPNELTGLNPYAPQLSNSPNNNPYNPYNPQRYVNSDYNPYNPTSYVDPNYNPYNPTSYTDPNYNPYLASSPYNAGGGGGNDALLAALGGSAANVHNQSQFDLTWLTEIEQAQGVQHYLDYGSFSSPSSAAFRGIVRPLQLTAVNQQDLAAYINATGNTPSTIAMQVNVLDDSPGGVTSFASLEDYDERRSGRSTSSSTQEVENPFGYGTFAGTNAGSNANRVQSYEDTGTTTATSPTGYDTGPLFAANNPGGNRIGSFDTATSYDDNRQGSLFSTTNGYTSPSGDPLSYGGATGYDGYDSGAARAEKQEQIDAEQQRRTQENIARMEEERKIREAEKAMQELTESALELASRGPSVPEPSEEGPRKPTNTRIIEISPGVYVTIQDDQIEEVAPGQYKDKETYDPAFDVPDEIERKYREQKDAEKTLDEDFEERFGKVEDGGYQFDDPYASGEKPDPLTPLEGTIAAYGTTIEENGWGDYIDLPKYDYNTIPEEIRQNEDFARIMRYKYYLENPDVTAEELSEYDRFLTGRPHDENNSGTLWLETVERTATDPRSWEATREGLYDIPRDIWGFVSGTGKAIWEGGESFVEMTPQERGILFDALFLASAQTLVDVFDPNSGDPVDKAIWNAIDFYSSGNAIEQLSALPPEIQAEYEELRKDFLNNPEKYTREGVTLAVGAALEEGVFGILSKAPKVLGIVDTVEGITDSGVRIGGGAFGDVYRLADEGIVVKVMKADDYDAAIVNANRQIQGANLLSANGIPHTQIYGARAFPDEGKIVINMQDALKYGPDGGAYLGKSGGIGTLNDAEFEAFTNLISEIDRKGLVWGDAKPSNVFFYNENGVLKAGVLDHDLIMTKSEYSELGRKYRAGELAPGSDHDNYFLTSTNGLINGVGGSRVTYSDQSRVMASLREQGVDIATVSPNQIFLEAARLARE